MKRLIYMLGRLFKMLRSQMARPYLDSATNYIELQLNRAGIGDFDIDVDAASGVVYYRVVVNDVKYTITLTVGSPTTDEAIMAERRGEDESTEIVIDLSELVWYSPSMMLPYNIIDKMLSVVVS